MKKSIVKLAAVTVLAFAGLGGAAEAQEHRWQFFGALPTTHEFSKRIMEGLERVEERSEGRLAIQYSYFAETPYKPAESLTLIRDGLVQMTEWLPAFGVATYPVLAAPELPFIVPTLQTPAEMQEAVSRAWDTPAISAALNRIMEDHNAVVLGRYFYQPMNLWSAKDLATPADFEGQRFRVQTPEIGEFLEQLGVIPMNIPNTEVYTSLQTNVIDGAITGSGNIKGSKWNEVLKSGYITNMMLVGTRLVISKEALAELPEDLQKIVVEEMAAVERAILDYTPDSDKSSLEELAAEGMTITHASEADYARYREIAATKVWPAWKERVGADAETVMQEIEAVFAE